VKSRIVLEAIAEASEDKDLALVDHEPCAERDVEPFEVVDDHDCCPCLGNEIQLLTGRQVLVLAVSSKENVDAKGLLVVHRS
jgi:hypothetical protein